MAAWVSTHLVADPALHVLEQDLHDLGDVLPGERMEHHDVVQPVQELGLKTLFISSLIRSGIFSKLAFRPSRGIPAPCPA